MKVAPVDPADLAGYAAFHEVYEAASRFGPQGEHAVPWSLDEARISLADLSGRRPRLAWAGWPSPRR